MEIKTNMANHIADLCTCVSGTMMYDKRLDESQGGIM